MDQTATLAVFLLLIGPFVGSFMAVLVDRLPRGEDVIGAPSTCRDCGMRLKPRHLIPIISFALQRGRCARCGGDIPAGFLYLELLASGAVVLVLIRGGTALDLALNALFLWLLITLAATDLRWFRLPDVLTAGLALVSMALAVVPGGIGLFDAFLGATLGAGAFMALRLGYNALRRREGLGLGDVKVMIGLGAFTGPIDLPLLVLFAALGGLGLAVTQSIATNKAMRRTQRLPFGAFLCAAAAVLWILG